MVRFWWLSASASGSVNFLKDSLLGGCLRSSIAFLVYYVSHSKMSVCIKTLHTIYKPKVLQSDEFTAFELRQLFSHPYAAGGKFVCTYNLNVTICDM